MLAKTGVGVEKVHFPQNSLNLALGAETVWRLQQRDQQGGTNWTDRGNLPQQLHGLMPVALHQQVVARLLTHRLQQIQLLVKPFGPSSNSRFYNLGQPFGAMTWGIDGATATGNGPAAVQCFDPTHPSGEILGDGQIAATQFF